MMKLRETIHTFISRHWSKKRSKKVICVCVIALILVYLGFRLGVISPSREMVLWYFNANRDDFEKIVQYVSEHPDMNIDVYDCETTDFYSDFWKLDRSVKWLVYKTFALGFYSRIADVGYSDAVMVKFSLADLIVRRGEAYGFLYSEKEEYMEVGSDWITVYEKIDENWYYVYRYE